MIGKREALRLAPRIRRAGMAPLGSSFWQGVVRGILRAAVLMAGHGEKLKVASSERTALDAMLQVAGPGSPGREELDRALGGVWAALGLARPGSR